MNVLDLFSGIGGFSLGLQRVGFTTQYFCEIDPYCRRVLAKHWPHVPCFEDVQTLHGADLGPIDLICGGFPCQDISTAGKGAGLSGARSGLWSEYARLIQEVRPKYVLIENVAALRSRGLDQVLREIAKIGYDAEWHCIPASAVGAPHRRDRVWIVAYVSNTQSKRTQGGIFQPRGSSQLREDGFPQSLADTHTGFSNRENEEIQPRGNAVDTSRTDVADPDRSGCSLEQHTSGCTTTNRRRQKYTQPSSPTKTDVADPDRGRFLQREPQGELEARASVESERCGAADVSDTQQQRPQGWLHRWEDQERKGEQGYLGRYSSVDGQPIKNWWAVEPAMGELVNGVSGGLVRFNGRVATNIPNRVNKLKGLGNAVVPQIVEVLGRLILQYEAERLGPQDEESA